MIKFTDMKTRLLMWLLLLGSLFSLSACVQQSEVRQMKHSVSTLNQEMTQLIDILHALKDVDPCYVQAVA